jgi:phytoene synthase
MTTALEHFTATANRAANEVIDSYSTSFGKATRLLGPRHRQHVRAIYALVRVADEIVDGVAAQAGLTPAEQRAALDRFEEETVRAMGLGYSADVVVHAFARTAKECGIGTDLTEPFFASMRMDLDAAGDARVAMTKDEHDRYVYGSAAVVGLMCLRVFVRSETHTTEESAALELGARRLGEAFQDINFLRDLAADDDLGRSYLSATGELTEAAKTEWVAQTRSALADAAAVFGLLPRDARGAVRCAHDLFSELVDRIEATPAADLYSRRVRVPDAQKAVLAARAALWARFGRNP